MDCPHCGKAFHDMWGAQYIIADGSAYPHFSWFVEATLCPSCKEPTFVLNKQVSHGQHQPYVSISKDRIYPINALRKPTPSEVPKHIAEDYEEACIVLPLSQKASAALSRRCLQAILWEKGYPQKDLAKQIDALLSETNPPKVIPTGLHNAVDAIRNFGNFSAHPLTDQNTLQIITVDVGEAEWCLEILEEMFDHYYVKPAQVAVRKAALDAKLLAAGKPPSK
jgi:hypothetical protein